jgi:hypothetical protein
MQPEKSKKVVPGTLLIFQEQSLRIALCQEQFFFYQTLVKAAPHFVQNVASDLTSDLHTGQCFLGEARGLPQREQ